MPEMEMTPEEKAQTEAHLMNGPTFWFAVMELSKSKGNFKVAAKAKAKLEDEFGIRVIYTLPVPRKITKPEKDKETTPCPHP